MGGLHPLGQALQRTVTGVHDSTWRSTHDFTITCGDCCTSAGYMRVALGRMCRLSDEVLDKASLGALGVKHHSYGNITSYCINYITIAYAIA